MTSSEDTKRAHFVYVFKDQTGCDAKFVSEEAYDDVVTLLKSITDKVLPGETDSIDALKAIIKERDEWHGRFCRADAHRDELKSELAALKSKLHETRIIPGTQDLHRDLAAAKAEIADLMAKLGRMCGEG